MKITAGDFVVFVWRLSSANRYSLDNDIIISFKNNLGRGEGCG